MSDMFIKLQANKAKIASFKDFSAVLEQKLKESPRRIFPNSVNYFTPKDTSFTSKEEIIEKIPKKTKTIYVELKNKKRLDIQFNINQEKDLTVGWLLSEALRNMKDYHVKKNSNFVNEEKILFLSSQDHNYNLDYWLTFLERSISVIKDGQILIPIYADSTFEINEKTEKIHLNYFNFQQIIGSGGFSKVILVRRKDNGLFYAIKVINKKFILKKQKEKFIFNERNIWKNLDNDFIVKLHCSFQNNENLFFVMDYCPGGELFFHLQKRGKISEDDCKFFAYEILLAFQYLHSKFIVYRDLKPENVLIDIDGHIKLTDFGLAKNLSSKKELTYTFCGSPEYLAPEMINKSGHSISLDYYCFGVFIYELCAGFPPSLGNKKSAVFDDILKNDLKFPSHFSRSLKSLISKLMDKNPHKRLGSISGEKEILSHEWFIPSTEEKNLRKMTPHIKPNVYNFYVDKEIQQKFINYYDFFCNDESFSPKNPLVKNFLNFSFCSLPLVPFNGPKERENKQEYLKEASEMIYSPSSKPIAIHNGDLNEEEEEFVKEFTLNVKKV